MNSVSPGTWPKRPSRQSCLAWSIRSCELDTKFHHMWRGPSGAPRVGYQARDISGGFGNSDPRRLADCRAGTDMTWSRLAVMR